LIIIQLDGLDLDTLKEINNESGTFLSTLITPNLSTAVFNRNNEKFSLGSCENQSKNPETTKKTLEDYLMTQEELIINNFDFSPDFLEAEDREIEDRLSLVSIDCEMVLCGEQKKLARVTLIDKNFEILMDELIKIPETITDYLTKYSGITEAMISEARLDFEETQRKVLTFISKKTILCGHSLENDLFFLKIKHFRVIDTSVIFPHPTQGYKLSLKHLTFNYLNKTIQKVFENQGTHDSAEDASAALELVYLKVQNGPSFGVKSRSNYPDVTEILKNEGKNIKTLKNFQEFQQSEKVSIFYIQLEEIEKNFNFSDRKGEISSIVAGWEEKIKEILRNLDDQTGMILLSSLGDVKYSEQ
jgi:DNA polymerase III epsilon subunit-like protein